MTTQLFFALTEKIRARTVYRRKFHHQLLDEFHFAGPPHPGQVLRENVLPSLGMTRKEFAAEMGVSYSTLSKLLNRRCRLSHNLALRLACITATPPLYWFIVQAHHDAWVARHPGGGARCNRSRATQRLVEGIVAAGA
jgi:antitoxin HigA-1